MVFTSLCNLVTRGYNRSVPLYGRHTIMCYVTSIYYYSVLPLRPCSHCRSCAGTVPICRISGVCERAMSAIKLDLISENLIRSREGSVFRHNYLCRNKCNVNTDLTYVGERWRCRLDIINVVHVNDSQSIYLLSIYLFIVNLFIYCQFLL